MRCGIEEERREEITEDQMLEGGGGELGEMPGDGGEGRESWER